MVGLLGAGAALETPVPSLKVSVGVRIGRWSLVEGLLKGSMASALGLSSRPSRDSGAASKGGSCNPSEQASRWPQGMCLGPCG